CPGHAGPCARSGRADQRPSARHARCAAAPAPMVLFNSHRHSLSVINDARPSAEPCVRLTTVSHYFSFAVFSCDTERFTMHWLGSMSRSNIMPLFYFHLGFGGRILRDDEGTELESRAAARAEAQAIIRELAPTAASCSFGHPTNWFLRVADADGQFLHLPIDRPALEVVTADHRSEPPPTPARADQSASPLPRRAAEVLARFLDRQRRTTALLRRNQQLRDQLSV